MKRKSNIKSYIDSTSWKERDENMTNFKGNNELLTYIFMWQYHFSFRDTEDTNGIIS